MEKYKLIKPEYKPKIFLWLNCKTPGWYLPMAMAEDGTCLASHASSNESWAWHDIGLTSDWKHDLYAKKYPDGYELVRVDNPKTHEGLMAAYALNQKMAEAAKGRSAT